jgi:hypothetical protein
VSPPLIGYSDLAIAAILVVLNAVLTAVYVATWRITDERDRLRLDRLVRS